MRKVLLTTTALVAFGGVSAASALDISGGYMFDYTINDNGTANTSGMNNTSMSSDARFNFSGSTTSDAGLEFGGAYAINHAGNVEDQGVYVSGDFGYAMFGATDGVVDNMDTFMHGGSIVEVGAGTANSTVNTSAIMTDTATAEKIGFRSPVISGFQLGFSHTDAGRNSKADNNQWMATYDFGVAKVGYGSSTIGAAAGTSADTKQTQMGIGSTMGDFTLKYATGTDATHNTSGGETSKIDTNNWAVYYGGLENMTVYYVGVASEEKTGDNSGDKLDSSTIGLSYTITDGVSALIESGNNDFTDSSDTTGNDQSNYTRFGLAVTF